MAPVSSLNRRHKVGLFLVLVATGVCLFFEASAKQTAGVALLGIAFAWVLGSLSLLTLRFLCSIAAGAVGADPGRFCGKTALAAVRAEFHKQFSASLRVSKESPHLADSALSAVAQKAFN